MWQISRLSRTFGATVVCPFKQNSTVLLDRYQASTKVVIMTFQDGPKGPAVLYENTFQLEPRDEQKFPTKKAEDVIKVTMKYKHYIL